MRQKNFQKILQKYKKGLCNPEEEALVQKWLGSIESAHDNPLHTSAKAQIKNRSWTRVHDYIVQDRIRETKQFIKPQIKKANHGLIWSMAAALLLLIVSGVFLFVRHGQSDRQISSLQSAEKNILNNTGEVMEVSLEDGSQVLLTPRSKISYKEPFDGPQRLVTLEGEAFFTVSRDTLRPFVVNTNEVITRVLGTSFRVSAFSNEANVTVEVMTGTVSVTTKKDGKVTSDPSNETILTPNQKIIYNKDKHVASRAIVQKPLPILPVEVVKQMHFEGAPVGDIFHGLEQVYGVAIKFDKHVFSSCILTTTIGEGSIYDRLDMICKAIDAKYALKENQIVITGAGCNE